MGVRSVEENRERQAAYYRANREKYLVRARAYYKATREERLAYGRTYHAENIELMRHKKLLRHFGIGVSEYDAMVIDQGGGCAICGETTTNDGRRLPVDHDHETGRVRGVLCVGCNRGLGMFDDNPDRLRSAADYLERAQEQQKETAG